MKLNGVCEHHDFGCLGAALSEDALHRKLTKLKAMGVNAIRSSHNPPAPELLAMCDTMGLIVMARPVEIEFAVNLHDDRSGEFYLLQIRPMVDNQMQLDEDLTLIPDSNCLIRSHNANNTAPQRIIQVQHKTFPCLS